jgi:hypothetical protein
MDLIDNYNEDTKKVKPCKNMDSSQIHSRNESADFWRYDMVLMYYLQTQKIRNL